MYIHDNRVCSLCILHTLCILYKYLYTKPSGSYIHVLLKFTGYLKRCQRHAHRVYILMIWVRCASLCGLQHLYIHPAITSWKCIWKWCPYANSEHIIVGRLTVCTKHRLPINIILGWHFSYISTYYVLLNTQVFTYIN